MVNDFILSASTGKAVETVGQLSEMLNTAKATLLQAVAAPADALRRYYSGIIGRDVSRRQLFHLLHVQVAFAFAALPADGPLMLRAACCAWFAWAAARCRRAL